MLPFITPTTTCQPHSTDDDARVSGHDFKIDLWGCGWYGVGAMRSVRYWLGLLGLAAGMWCTEAQATEVILTGGVALTAWEHLRGPAKHDNWWANFVRASTVRMEQARSVKPGEKFVWIVFRPAYVSRGREDKKDYLSMIRDLATKYNASLIFVDTADAACAAINGVGKGKITSFYYFGHSNAYAFMLDYSNTIIGSSKQWIHEKDLARRIRRDVFAPGAKCYSYGCYTGRSMSAKWKKCFGVPLVGNMESTRYQPVGDGHMPTGAGMWVE